MQHAHLSIQLTDKVKTARYTNIHLPSSRKGANVLCGKRLVDTRGPPPPYNIYIHTHPRINIRVPSTILFVLPNFFTEWEPDNRTHSDAALPTLDDFHRTVLTPRDILIDAGCNLQETRFVSRKKKRKIADTNN